VALHWTSKPFPEFITPEPLSIWALIHIVLGSSNSIGIPFSVVTLMALMFHRKLCISATCSPPSPDQPGLSSSLLRNPMGPGSSWRCRRYTLQCHFSYIARYGRTASVQRLLGLQKPVLEPKRRYQPTPEFSFLCSSRFVLTADPPETIPWASTIMCPLCHRRACITSPDRVMRSAVRA
jgi:hypothetical protein